MYIVCCIVLGLQRPSLGPLLLYCIVHTYIKGGFGVVESKRKKNKKNDILAKLARIFSFFFWVR
jgi:hypothetical protein